jgi:hypothetical protein
MGFPRQLNTVARARPAKKRLIKMSWLRQPTRPRDASRTHVRRASRCSKAITCCRAFEAISSTSSAATKRRTLNSKRLRGWLATMPKDRQRRWRSWTALRYRPQSSPGRGNANCDRARLVAHIRTLCGTGGGSALARHRTQPIAEPWSKTVSTEPNSIKRALPLLSEAFRGARRPTNFPRPGRR